MPHVRTGAPWANPQRCPQSPGARAAPTPKTCPTRAPARGTRGAWLRSPNALCWGLNRMRSQRPRSDLEPPPPTPPRPKPSALPVPLGRGCGRSVRGLLRLPSVLNSPNEAAASHPDGPCSRSAPPPLRSAGPEPLPAWLESCGRGRRRLPPWARVSPVRVIQFLPLPARPCAPAAPRSPDLICAYHPGAPAQAADRPGTSDGRRFCPEG